MEGALRTRGRLIMAQPTIGVVVPAFNSASTLDWTLCSLRNQKDCAVQIIVADSGSTDGTLDICKKWNVPTVFEPPGSMYRAINAGSRELKTPWMAYVNSDDLMYADAYARLTQLGQPSGADIVSGRGDYIDEAGRFISDYPPASPQQVVKLARHGYLGFTQPAA